MPWRTPGQSIDLFAMPTIAFLALQGALGIGEFWNHDTLSCLALGDGLSNNSDNVCCAIINSSSVGMT